MKLRPCTKDSKLYIPSWCIDDTPIPDKYDFTISDVYYVCDNLSYDEYKKMRKMTYFACKWYPYLIKNNIPTINSNLISTTMLDLREDLSDNWKEGDKKFIRTCGSSPKDMIDVPIFANPKRAADSLMRSARTLNIMHNYSHLGKTHLFIRDVATIDYECRCFIHDHKLRAVSVYQYIELDKRSEFEEYILDFMQLYEDKLPYNSCIMELGLEEGGFPFVVEFNSFGIDGFADASLFDWNKEYPILYYSEKVEFRYPVSVYG